jgi:flagellar hook-associated protein 2
MSTSSIDLTSSVLDVGTIVDSLIYVDGAPMRLIQNQVTALQNKASAYQSLNTKLSALSDKVNSLLFGDTNAPFVQPTSFSDRLSSSIFSQCAVTSSDDSLIAATASSANATGSYSITVSSLARANTEASSGFADTTTTQTGTGTLTITTGSNAPVSVTIDSSNNTLRGVCEAINNSRAGVTATIINDGSATPYKLLITANDTGTANSFTISDGLSGGQALGFSQTQGATDAQFLVNGVSITKSSNTISDVISGVTFTLKDETASPVTLRVDRDADSIVKAINEFITAYNAVNTYINSQFAYNASTKTAGLLSGDATLRHIQSKLQSQFTQTISNSFTDYTTLGQVGLDFNRDGSLSLNESDFRAALSDDFSSVAALFLGEGPPPGGTSVTDSRVTYGGKTSATQPGTYDILISTLAQQASATGNQTVTALASNETLTITNGTATAVVSLLQNDTITDVLSKINNELSAQGIAATAVNDGTDRIRIATANYGSSESFTIVSDVSDTPGSTGFGTSPVVATGVDIAGTINGHAAVGNGLTLTGAAGQPEEGLALTIAQTTTGSYGSITVAPAMGTGETSSALMSLFSALDGLTDPLSGPIHNATDGLNKSIDQLNNEIDAYQTRLDKEKEMLTQLYNQADEALRLMKVTQASLASQLSSLPS